MANGKIHCCGSSLFLKRLYGVGYTFTVSLSIGIKFEDVQDAIDEIVSKHVANSQLLSMAGGEINYRLPFQDSSAFAPMFEDFDNLLINQINPVNSYGISVTTLEEVFLKIGTSESAGAKAKVQASQRGSIIAPLSNATGGNIAMTEMKLDARNEDDVSTQQNDKLGINENEDNPFAQPEFHLGLSEDAGIAERIVYEVSIFLLHTWCVMYRRFWWLLRDIRNMICQIAIPGGLAAVGLSLVNLIIQTGNYPELELTVNQWYSPDEYNVPISNTTGNINPISVEYGSWVSNGYNNYMEDEFGSLKTYDIELEDLYNGTTFSRMLLADALDHDIVPYNGYYIPPNETDYFVVGFNLSGYHSLPIARNSMRNWILRSQFDSDASIKISNYPLKQTDTEKAFDDFLIGLLASIFIVMAFTFVPVGAIFQIVYERAESNTKHQQFVSGMYVFVCFVFVWDVCSFFK